MIHAKSSASVFPTTHVSKKSPKWQTILTRLLSLSKIHLSSRAIRLILAIFLVGSPFLALTFVRISQYQASYKIAQLEDEQAALLNKQRVLELEVAVRKRPARILQIAEGRLGLSKPNSKDILRINKGVQR